MWRWTSLGSTRAPVQGSGPGCGPGCGPSRWLLANVLTGGSPSWSGPGLIRDRFHFGKRLEAAYLNPCVRFHMLQTSPGAEPKHLHPHWGGDPRLLKYLARFSVIRQAVPPEACCATADPHVQYNPPESNFVFLDQIHNIREVREKKCMSKLCSVYQRII